MRICYSCGELFLTSEAISFTGRLGLGPLMFPPVVYTISMVGFYSKLELKMGLFKAMFLYTGILTFVKTNGLIRICALL